MTRADKDKEVINLSGSDLLKLERDNRKKVREAKMLRVIVTRGADGKLKDAEGQEYNAQGQKLDAEGRVIPEEMPHVNEDRRILHGNRGGGGDRNGGGRDGALTLADMNRPATFYENRSSLVPPPIDRPDFELRLQYYSAVAQNPFRGVPSDHPMDHLERFENLLDGIKATGVDGDYFKLQLFPHSLAGDALNWLNTQPRGRYSTWDELRKAFLDHFFDDAKSEELRTRISNFEQEQKETFKSAWMRFLKLQRDCPHHGFSPSQLLTTFFKGVDWRHQQSLDSASNGNFMTRSTESAIELIHNLSQSNSTKRCDEQRARESVGNPKDMHELKESMKSIQNMLLNKKTVSFVDEVEQQQQEEQDEDCNFVGAGFQGQRFSNNFRNFGNNGTGFGAANRSAGFNSNSQQRNWGNDEYRKPAKSEEAMQGVLDQILEGQSKIIGNFNTKFDSLYTEINQKFDVVNNHLKKLDVQVAQNAESLRRPNGSLPGGTVQNPRQQINTIERGFAGNDAVCDSEFNDHCCGCVLAGKTHQKTQERSGSQLKLEKRGKNLEFPGDVAIATCPLVRSQHLSEGGQLEFSSMSLKDFKPIPPPPRPSPVPIRIVPKMAWSLEHVVTLLSFYVPEVPLCRDSPLVRQILEKTHSRKLEFNVAVDLLKNVCEDFMSSPSPIKKNDPGKCLLDCTIKGQEFNGVLVDSGACVSVMPLSTAAGFGRLKPYPEALQLADSTTHQPAGWLTDVPVIIGGCTVLTDFVVMDWTPQEPLLLGRGFLATAGAVIDFKTGLLSLHLPTQTVTFEIPGAESQEPPTRINTIFRAPEEEDECVEGDNEEKLVAHVDIAISPTATKPALEQQAPPPTPRYENFRSKKRSKSKRTHAGKQRIVVPPVRASHPMIYLGRAHAPNAYTPPWMQRFMENAKTLSIH